MNRQVVMRSGGATAPGVAVGVGHGTTPPGGVPHAGGPPPVHARPQGAHPLRARHLGRLAVSWFSGHVPVAGRSPSGGPAGPPGPQPHGATRQGHGPRCGAHCHLCRIADLDERRGLLHR